MADDVASLGFAVDSSQAAAGAAALDQLSAAAGRAQTASQGVGLSQKEAATQTQRAGQEMQRAQGAAAAFAVANEALNRQMIAMAGGLGVVGNVLAAYSNAGLLAAVGIKAVSDAFGSLSQSAHNIADKADQLKRFAGATGLTTDQIQLLSKEAHQFGLSGEEIQGGLQRFVAGFESLRKGGGPLLDSIRGINAGLAEQMQADENAADALGHFQEALQQAGNQFKQNDLVKAGMGRGGLGTIEFWKSADLSKMNGDIASIGHGLEANLIEKARKLKFEIEEVDRKIQHAAGANWAPFILALELMAKDAKLAAIKGVNAIIPSQSNATASYVSTENAQRIDAAVKEQQRLNAAIETAKRIYGDADNPWAERLNLELENATRKLQELQAAAQKTIEIDLKLNLPKLDIKDVQNAVFGAVALKAPTVNVAGGETSGVVKGIAETSAQVEAYKKLQEVLGSLIPVQEQMAQKRRELILADQAGIKLTKEQIAELLARSRLEAEDNQVPAGQAQRQVDELNKLKAAYPGLTKAQAESARELDNQLKLAQAVTGAEKMMVQEAQNYQKALKDNTPAQAQAIALKQTAIAQAQLNAGAEEQLNGLRDQFAVSSAVTGVEKARASAQATTNALIRQGVDSTKAMAVGEQQFANAMAQAESGARAQLLTLQDQAAAAGAVTGAEKIAAQGQATFNALIRDGVSYSTAQAVAEQQMSNAVAAVNAQVANQIISLQESTQLIDAQRLGIEGEVKAQIAFNQAIRQGASEEMAFALQRATLDNADAQRSAQQEQARKSGGGIISPVGVLYKQLLDQYNKLGGNEPYNPAIAPGFRDKSQQTGLPVAQGQFDEQQLRNRVDQSLQGGGGLQGAIDMLRGLTVNQASQGARSTVLLDLINRLAEQTGDKTQANASMQQQLDLLRSQPETLARDDAIKSLMDAMKQNTDAVNSNTGALSDLYQTDPRFSHIGFRASSTTPLDVSKLPSVTAPPLVPGVGGPGVGISGGPLTPGPYGGTYGPSGVPATGVGNPYAGRGPGGAYTDPATGQRIMYMADGGIMTAYGAMPLRRYEGGGVANSPQLAMYGEGDGPEAFVPLDHGAIPVRFANDNGGRGDTKVDNHFGDIIINGSVDASTLDKIKLSQFQQAQDVKRAIGVRK